MRQLPNWIDAYQHYTSASEAPDTFHYWTGVSVLAGALRRHAWVDMGHFQWTPCFYIIFVAPPGIVSKSTTADTGMNLLREVPGIQFGPSSVTWQSLVQSLANSTEGFDYESELHPMSPITIVSSELGTFLNPHNTEMVDVLVSLWDGQIGVFEKATKTMGNDRIVNPWINLIGCTTPAWIQANFPEYMIGGGFTSRTIFVYAEEKRQLVAYPGDEMTEEQRGLKTKLIHDLEHISVEIIGPYNLTDEAKAYGERWYEELYEESKESLVNDPFAGYRARKQSHLHKLAMIISASYKDERTITLDDFKLARHHLEESEKHQQQVFSRIVAQEAKATNLLLEVMRKSKRMTKSKLLQTVMRQMSQSQFDEGLNAGVAAGLLQIKQIGNDHNVLYIGPEETQASTENPVRASG